MHSSGGHAGYPQGYYGQGQAHGQFRHPGYPHMPSASNPSFQSMTSHWNISAPPTHPPVPTYQPHTASSGSSSNATGGSSSSGGGGGGGGGKNKHTNNLSQFGLDIPQPKAPDKPLLPYMRFSRKMWEQLKAEGKRVCEVQSVGKLIGQKWRELSDEDKQPFFEEYEAEKAVYVEQVKRYKSSPAYKKWMEAKQQAEAAAREAALSNNALHNEYAAPPPPPSVIAPSRQPGAAEARMQMLQQQEEEEDEYITMKQMAAVRFHRNHRLMLEIFNNVSVPDTRTVVNKSRLQLLKKQVQSLTIHQKKLEDELSQLDARFEARKRKFVEDSEKFRRELKRIQDNPPTSWKKPQVCLSPKDVPQPIENPKFKKL